METTNIKRVTSFRLSSELLDTLRSRAKATHRSLNNYVECLLLDATYYEPNEETLAAMQELRSGAALESFDNVDSLMKSLDAE